MTMARSWKQCESLLRRMAESMGLMIVSVPARGQARATWHVARRQGSYVFRLTVSYFSPKRLLDKFLNYYREFIDRPGLGQTAFNPFFGMSPEEAELKLAAMGA